MPEENNVNNENNEIKPEGSAPKDFDLVRPLAEVEKLKAELGESIRERDEYLDGWKRAKADFINYKKEELFRLEEMARFGNEDIIRDLVPVLDSFAALEKNFKSEPHSTEVERELGGMFLIKTQLEDILKRRGLEKIKVTPGETFNPNYHESVGTVETNISTVSYQSGAVAEEVETGYVLQGKVLRPARVKLVK